jgi:predicted nuclease of predicted toxin-antitoxin system
MRFKVDENLPNEIAIELCAAGHDAETVHAEGLTGADDSVILAHIQSEARTLLTLDKGIGDIRRYPPGQYHGIVLLRPRTTGRAATLAFVQQHMPQISQIPLAGRLVVVSDTGIRLR